MSSVQQNLLALQLQMSLNRIIHPVQGVVDVDRIIDLIDIYLPDLKRSLPVNYGTYIKLEANIPTKHYKVKVKLINLH